ncbi:MAG: tetratricopeptide repeat protein, partial [Thermoanaerobaculia bacterium]|nr:tetratricopeptide repeat protein [Thermoanaerobaculia bacterium]
MFTACRYASAEALREDLGRYLDGLPVTARPDTLRYRAGKFVRRHRFAVAAAAAVFLLTLGFGAVMATQAARIADQAEALATERDRAQQEAAKAEQTAAFLADLFEAADPAARQGGALTARDLLDRGGDRLRRDFAEQPDVQAELMDVLARTYANLGHYPDALALADAAHEARLAAFGPDHPEAARGLYRRGEAQLLNGHFADAEA